MSAHPCGPRRPARPAARRHPPASSDSVDRDRPGGCAALGGAAPRGCRSSRCAHRGDGVARAGAIDVEQHRVGDLEAGAQRLGLGGDEPVERGPAPGHEALRRLLAHHLAALLRVVARLGEQPSRSRSRAPGPARRPARRCRTRPGPPARRSGGTPGPAAAACRRPSYLTSAVNSTVRIGTLMPDAEGVGAADDLEQAGLGQLLDQAPVLGQHAGVVHADAVAHQPGQGPAEAGGEPEARRSPRRSRPSPARVQTLMLISAWARSSAAAWVKCTT